MAKKRKKKTYSTLKKIKHLHKNEKLNIIKMFNNNTRCSTCNNLMANHNNRFTCTSCQISKVTL